MAATPSFYPLYEAVVDAEPSFDGLARACNPPLADMSKFVVVNEAPVSSILTPQVKGALFYRCLTIGT